MDLILIQQQIPTNSILGVQRFRELKYTHTKYKSVFILGKKKNKL